MTIRSQAIVLPHQIHTKSLGKRTPVLVTCTQPESKSHLALDQLIVAVAGNINPEHLPAIAGYLDALSKGGILNCDDLITLHGEKSYKPSDGFENAPFPLDVFQGEKPQVTSSSDLFRLMEGYKSRNKTAALVFLSTVNDNISQTQNTLSTLSDQNISAHLIGVGNNFNPHRLLELSKFIRGGWEILGEDRSVTGKAAQAILAGIRTCHEPVSLQNNSDGIHTGFLLGHSIRESGSSDLALFSPSGVSESLFLNPPDFTVPVFPPRWKLWASKPKNPFSINTGGKQVHPDFIDFDKLSSSEQNKAERKLLEVLRFIAIKDKDTDLYRTLARDYGKKHPDLFPENTTDTILTILENKIIDEDYLSLLNRVSVPSDSPHKALEITPIEIPPLPVREIARRGPKEAPVRLRLLDERADLTISPEYSLGGKKISFTTTTPNIIFDPKTTTTNTITFGRTHGNVVYCKDHINVSKRQCTIFEEKGQIFIQDDRSKNGTLVNRQLLTKQTPLKDQDKIQINDIVFTVNIALDTEAETVRGV